MTNQQPAPPPAGPDRTASAQLAKAIGSAPNWRALAVALWAGTVVLPGQLAGAWGIDQLAWQSVTIGVAILATILAIALPETKGQASKARSGDDA